MSFNLPHLLFSTVFREANMATGRAQLRDLAASVAARARECEPDSEEQVVYQFAQFLVGFVGMEHAMLRHELNEVGDWVGWSLTVDIVEGPEQALEVGRFARFLDPITTTWPPFVNIYITWFDHFFYYARARSAMSNIAMFALPIVLPFFQMVWRTGVTSTIAKAVANVLAWSVQEHPEAAPDLVVMLETVAGNAAADGRARLIAAMTLGGRPGAVSAAGRQHWRTVALNDLSQWHQAHERLQLLVDEFGVHDDESLFREILQEIDAHQVWMNAYDPADIEVQRGLEAHSTFVQVALHACLAREQSERITALLAHWYLIPDSEAVESGTLLIQAPFFDRGPVMLLDGQSQHTPGDPQGQLVTLTDASNRFLGTFNSVAGNSADAPYQPDRPGVIDDTWGPAFEELLTQVYVPGPVMLEGRAFSRQLVIPSKAHPVQAVQLRTSGQSAPIAASFRRPHADRAVRRVALWSGAGSLTEEIERSTVAAIFRAAGVEVEVVAPHEASIERFLDLYQSPNFDVVWLMSHGVFNHYMPKSATVMVDSNEAQIGISDLLARAPTSGERRLLVLNVCDGGRFEEVGVLPRVGLAPAVASSAQATISHLWPIQPLAAAAFGALLAHHLARSLSYYDAFSQTLLTLHAGVGRIVQILRALGVGETDSLIQRIENATLDFENLAYSGSGAFYE
jgi:hypothetical protein